MATLPVSRPAAADGGGSRVVGPLCSEGIIVSMAIDQYWVSKRGRLMAATIWSETRVSSADDERCRQVDKKTKCFRHIILTINSRPGRSASVIATP
jgi:hypothetical protein